ncbi:MAG: hypothetical protein H6812_03660 [Phycisphaeraceae bacterium]|nr:hypothetical protein [Phycisphaerales bacterium]MCB9842334.1 hypothetical protein [Phycisphaeraceae bacterium]
MACVQTKLTEIQLMCINGFWHQAVFRRWACTDQINGVNYNWTKWVQETAWEDTEEACSEDPSMTPQEETQVALVGSGSQQQPVTQRNHQFSVMIPNVGPFVWVDWVDVT